MSYDRRMQEVIDGAQKEVKDLCSHTEETLEKLREKHNCEIKELVGELRQSTKETAESARHSLEETRKFMIMLSIGLVALILSAVFVFVYQEMKSLNSSMLDLHSNINSANQTIDNEVEEFQVKATKLEEQLDVAVERNQAAVSGLSRAEDVFERRIAEVENARDQYRSMTTGLQNLLDVPEVSQDWEGTLQEHDQIQ